MLNTSFLTREHVGTATLLAVEDKMSFPNLTLGKEHWLLEKESLLFNFTGLLFSHSNCVFKPRTLSEDKSHMWFWFGSFILR